MIDYRMIIRNRELRLKIIQRLSFIPTSLYLRMVFFIKTGKKLNLKNPVSFCDKQNWLKLNDIHPEYSLLVDKIAVRQYVNELCGRDMFFPLLGTWNHFEDIDFDALPNEFVLKCNHDSASVTVIKNKADMDIKALKTFYNNRLKLNIETIGREYPYKNVKPQILAEAYMNDKEGKELVDYKFFCFSGEPYIVLVASDYDGQRKNDFFDMDFEHLNITNIYPNSEHQIQKPGNFEEMKELAKKLSDGMKFVRVDLYEYDNKIYFGEFTFFHGGGFWPMKPYKWELDLGKMISLI